MQSNSCSCSQRGCVFPAIPGGTLCSPHKRQQVEIAESTSLPRPSLARLEVIIERDLVRFRIVAEALVEIKDRQLWKPAGYSSFVDYCRQRWNMSASTAYNYTRAKDVLDSLPPEKAATISVSQAVTLARLPKVEQAAQAVATDFSQISVREFQGQVDKQEKNPFREKKLDAGIAVGLRVPTDLVTRLHTMLQASPLPRSRSGWIIEAIREKLIRESISTGEVK